MATREKEFRKFRGINLICNFLIGNKVIHRKQLQIPVSPEQEQFRGPTMRNSINTVSKSDAVDIKHTANKTKRSQA